MTSRGGGFLCTKETKTGMRVGDKSTLGSGPGRLQRSIHVWGFGEWLCLGYLIGESPIPTKTPRRRRPSVHHHRQPDERVVRPSAGSGCKERPR